MNKAISIIVPVYNVYNCLDRCIKSLVNQSFEDIEIILINDGSTDNSGYICDMWAKKDNRIKVIHKHNEGLGFARNSGLDIAQGNYIAFVDSDDYMELNACEVLYNIAVKENLDIVCGGIYYDSDKRIIKCQYTDKPKFWKGKNETKNFLLNLIGTLPNNPKDTIYEVSVWKCLFKRSIFEDYHIRFESERKFISEDIIFNIDYIPHTEKIAVIPQCVYHYCIRSNSLSKVYISDRFEKNLILYNEILRKLEPLFSKEEYEIRTDRFLITKARTVIQNICNNRKNLTYSQLNKAINKVITCNELKEVLSRYPVCKLSKSKALFIYAIKKENLLFIKLLAYINSFIKGL